jgi:hypothetical protein
MKKLLILLFITINAMFANAQESITSPYGDMVTSYRLPSKELDRYKKRDINLYNAIVIFEKELDKKKRSVITNSSIYSEDIESFEIGITDAKPGFDLTAYTSEIKFYNTYRKKRLAFIKHVNDSTNEANKIAYEENSLKEKKIKDSLWLGAKKEDSIKRANEVVNYSRDTNYVGYPNKNLVMINGYNPNSVLNYIGFYMTDDFGFTYSDGPTKEIPGHITMLFKPRVTSNSKSSITFHFVVDNKKHVITKCNIDGYYIDVIKFFIEYWPTKINFDDVVKKQTAIEYLMTDKIILTVNAANKTAKIDVVRNK